MGAFTTISAGADLQSLGSGGGVKALNELLTAYDEHRQVLGQSAGPAQIVAGDDVQVYTLYYNMQNWIETYCTSFLNPTVDQAGKTAFEYYTWATLKTKLGWTGDGWRKSSAFAAGAFTMGKGKCAAGDYIQCTWLYTDLQNAFRELTRTARTNGAWSNGLLKTYYTQVSGESIPWSNVETQHATDWGAASWEGTDSYYRATVNAIWNTNDPPGLNSGAIISYRVKAKPYLDGIYNGRPHTAKVYFIPGTWTSYTFVDTDSLGFTTGQLYLIETLAQQTSASETGAYFVASDVSPYVGVAGGQPPEDSYYWKGCGSTTGTGATGTQWILDWAFTYT